MINTEPADGSDTSPGLCRTITAASDSDSLPGQREIEVEGSAFPMAAFHSNLSRMLLNNAVGHGQTESCTSRLAFARRRLGRKEWIVNPVNVLLRNTAARIGDHHPDAVAIRCGDAERSAIAHRVFGIQEQVQEHLLQPPRIAVDQRDLRAALVLYFDLRYLE